jgi:hypothetical protein
MERKRQEIPPNPNKRNDGIPADQLPLPFGFTEEGKMISLEEYLALSKEEKLKIRVGGVRQDALS